MKRSLPPSVVVAKVAATVLGWGFGTHRLLPAVHIPPREVREMKRFALILLLVALPAFATAAPTARKMCVFDPSGTHGDLYKFAERFQAAALAWGVKFHLKVNTNEVVATSDFKAGKCQAVLMTSLRARTFVKSTGTLEAIGALPSYKHLHKVIKVLSSPKAKRYVIQGDYEAAAILPGGAIYLLLGKRGNASMSKLAGKRIATLVHDKPGRVMVDTVGASMVAAEVGTFAGIFNNGRADACYAPASAIKPLELLKGMKKGGGIVRYPLAQLSFQVLVRSKEFGPDFGQKARKWAAGQFKESLKMAKRAERALPGKYWIEVSDADKALYDLKLREVRIRMRAKGVYHGGILRLMKRIRCKMDKARPECKDKRE